ncbi:7030_t:CDS:2 [Acaulospora morrowiae]|uniref:5'-nucleotidase n=1 Tax=Acaulospora morrowiae TaxID=94023 RepID=A0A9N9GU52_9GLOM|nr:7030_t:CDS:2 [Acaulospora morrowiae]
MSSSLENVQQLINSIQHRARIRDIETTRKKLLKITKDGLMFFPDFDFTMTRYFTSTGERNKSSHGIVETSSRLAEEYKREVKALFAHYHPIEISTEKTKEEKTPEMIEWWRKTHKLLMEQNVKEEDIKEIVAESNVEIRPGLNTLIEKCKVDNIPFLIFSAGISGPYHEKNLFYPMNMHIVSNEMGFNEKTGICDYFKEPLIHTFNKNEIMIKGSPYFTSIENRGNVILLGDSLSDVQMASGISHETCLSIGFLNYEVDKLLNMYLQTYDIVVVGDGPMDVVNFIVNTIS